MLGPLPELKPMARARMGYRCHGWRHLGRSTKRWRSAGIGSCRRTPLGGTRGSSALHAPDGRPEGSDGRHIDRKQHPGPLLKLLRALPFPPCDPCERA